MIQILLTPSSAQQQDVSETITLPSLFNIAAYLGMSLSTVLDELSSFYLVLLYILSHIFTSREHSSHYMQYAITQSNKVKGKKQGTMVNDVAWSNPHPVCLLSSRGPRDVIQVIPAIKQRVEFL